MIIEELHTIVKSEQVPVFGIGQASKMSEERSGYRPEDFLPGAKSVICFGTPIPKGIYSTKNYNLEATWRSQNLLYRRLDTISLRISILLEENGARAIPIYGCMPLGINKKGTVVGILNQLRMAEIAGIGAIGKNGLLIHSQYGSRLMLGGLITTAPLPVMRYPDNEEPGCPSECEICSDACPVNAIIPERKKVDIMRCLRYTARTPAMSRLKFLLLRVCNKEAAARYMNNTSFDEHTFHICSKCVSLCPYGTKE
jgi:epoxyqueuosine reductase QueG